MNSNDYFPNVSLPSRRQGNDFPCRSAAGKQGASLWLKSLLRLSGGAVFGAENVFPAFPRAAGKYS